MDNFIKYDFFIFDCDGVILNSNSIKTEAFRKTLMNENERDIKNLSITMKVMEEYQDTKNSIIFILK